MAAQHVSVADFRRSAARRLPRFVFDYVEGGAGTEAGLKRNLDAYGDVAFLPRRLVDVSRPSTAVSLWGRSHAMPVYLSPTGLNGLLRHGGDAMLARAAARAGIPFALSTAANMSIEEAARAGDGEKWFQLYVIQRDLARSLVDRALAADYAALILTVDVAVNGNRERDIRNGFSVPVRVTRRLVTDCALRPAWSLAYLRNGAPRMRNMEADGAMNLEAQAALLSRRMDAGFDFEALKWLRDLWPRPLIVKGLLRTDDAAACAAIGVDAVVMSNHGGRQVDGAVTGFETVEAAAARLDIPVFFDGGIRCGEDVIKGLCLGARMAGLGRAALYALAADGEAGVDRCLSLFKDDLTRTLVLLGAPGLAALGPDLLARRASQATDRSPG